MGDVASHGVSQARFRFRTVRQAFPSRSRILRKPMGPQLNVGVGALLIIRGPVELLPPLLELPVTLRTPGR